MARRVHRLMPDEAVASFDVEGPAAECGARGSPTTPRPGSETLVAEVGGEVVGFAAWAPAATRTAPGELYAIYLDPRAGAGASGARC